MPSISATVLMPTYNRCGLIGESIDSLLAQTRRPDRVLVVDDGSTDDTRRVVEAYGDAVEYLRKENGGKASALNFGLRQVEGGAVWIFDDDDLAAPHALERLADALDAAPDCGFSYGAHDTFQAAAGRAPPFGAASAPPRDHAGLRRALLRASTVFHGGMLIRKACLDAVGGFDERFIRAQDYELTLRLARRFEGAFAEGVMFHQRIHPGRRGSSLVRIAERNKYRVQLKYDQDIFRAVHTDYALAEYLPAAGEAPSPAATFAALIERAAVMGRKGLWDLVADDLEAALDAASEAGITRLDAARTKALNSVFDDSSAGTATYAAGARLQELFRARRGSPLLAEMRRALAAPLQGRLLGAARRRKPHEVLSFGLVLASVAPLPSKLLNDAGLGALKLVERAKDAWLARSRSSVR